MKTYSDFGIQIPYGRQSGEVKTYCPKCHDRRTDKRDKSLSVNLDKGIWNCHYCSWSGSLHEFSDNLQNGRWNGMAQKMPWNSFPTIRQQKPSYKKPVPNPSTQMSAKALAWFKGRGISEATLQALHVTEGMEWMPQNNAPSNTVQFNYYLNGELINTKFRTGDKKFKLVSGARLIPYNIDAIKGQKECIVVEGECFPSGTEVLTENGWIAFESLIGSEAIAQYNADGTINFAVPLARIAKPYEGNLVEFSNDRRNYYSLTTPKHNLVVLKYGKLTKVHAEDIPAYQTYIPRCGYIEGTGIPMNDDLLRLYVAISADFTIRKDGDIWGGFKKMRKVIRLRGLLDSLGLRYTVNKIKNGYYSVFIHREQGLEPFKKFPDRWLCDMTRHQREVLLSELVLWDGNHVPDRTMVEYSTKLLCNAIFVQTLSHTCGKISTIIPRSNAYGEWYKVTIQNRQHSTTSSKHSRRVPYRGMVYCLTMPSGMLLVRQNNIISVSGNCDALSFYEIGHHNVISVPNGANANLSYLDDFIEDYFDDKETIFIASDTDTKGVLLRDELLRRFGPERCRVLDYGEDCKDANEVLMRHGAEALEKCLQDAPEVKLDGVFTISDFEQSLDAIFENGLQRGFTVGFNNLDRLLSFETKRLCIVTGVPGCLAGDTLVSMADGTQKPIKDVQTGDKVVSYTKDYQRTTKEVITKWISGEKDVLQLNLRNGMSIQPTAKHKFLTFEGWKPAGEIEAGDFLLVGPTAVGVESTINPDMLKLMAIWLADGNKHNSSYVVTKKSGAIVTELYDICERNNLRIRRNDATGETLISFRKRPIADRNKYVSCISYYLRKQRGYTEDVSREVAARMYKERIAEGESKFNPVDELKKLGVWGLTTETLRVPNEVFMQTDENVALFLNRLFACDGWVTNKVIGYCSNSKRLCLDIQSLLLRFDVYMPIREKRVKYKGKIHVSYSVESASEPDILRMIERVGVIGKQGNYKPTGASKHSDFVPRRVLVELRNKPSYFREYGVYVHMDEKKPRISRSNALACAKAESNHELENKLNCRWVEVKSVVRKGIVSTFDLEVADTHNYLANNILLSNSGKSEFIDQITERLNIRYGWRFAYFSPENFPLAYHAAKLIEKFTGHKFSRANLTVDEYRQVKEHLEHNFFFIAPETGFSLDTILEKARFLVRRYGIKCLIIDPYNRLENEQGKQNETQYISGVLDKLTNFAQLNDVLVILMAHPVKMQKDKDGNVEVPSLYDISGSANFYNKADFGLTVHRHREENVVEVRVLKVKFRHLGETGSAFFRYNLINGRYVPCKGDGSDETTEWDNSNHLITPPREETFEEISDAGFSGSLSSTNAPKASSLPFGDPTDDAPF